MKLRCNRPSLMSAFSVVGNVVPARTPKEVLKNVKLQVREGKASLLGTDLEVGIHYQIPGVESPSEGEVLLPARRFSTILHELTEENVELEVTQDALWVRSGHSEFRLSLEDPAEFPDVAEFDESNYTVLQGRALREMIRRTLFATDEESTRYALGGVLFEIQGEQVTLAATDSRRLAVTRAECKSGGEGEPANVSPVVPSKAMQLIERSISEDDEEVKIAVHQNDVLVRSANSTVYSRLVEGRFPRYADVIPTDDQFNARIDLLVGPFYSAVRQAQIVTSEDSRGVDFVFAEGMLTLISQAADIGESKIQLPVSYDGAEIKILFDPRYVGEFLRVLQSEQQVRVNLIDSESAAVFQVDDAYNYVVMPLSRDRGA